MVDIAGKYANDPLMRKVMLGVEVKHFRSEAVGQYLIDRAITTRAVAMEQLADVDPTDESAIRRLQMEARIPDMMLQWLDDAEAEALAAEQAIEMEEMGGGVE